MSETGRPKSKRKHLRESWLSSSRHFEVLGVKLQQTLFFHFNFEKKYRKIQKFRIFFSLLFGLFCSFKTLTIDLVHFYDILTAENVGAGIPLSGYTTLI